MAVTALRKENRSSEVYAVAGVGSISIINAGLVVYSLYASRAVGRVLCVFNRSAYLQFNDRLVCLALHELGAGPLTAQLPKTLTALPACVYPDAKVHFNASGLMFENGHVLSLHSANQHDGVIRSVTLMPDWAEAISNLRNQLPLPHDGMARLFSEKAMDHSLLNYTAPAVRSLLQQISAFIVMPLKQNAHFQFDTEQFIKLLGVGPGLTPSGDDFIMGVFTCLNLLQHDACVRRLWSAMRDDACGKTTMVSCALLELAANDEHSERMQTLIALLVRYPQSSQRSVAQALNGIGNTSGWDWFAGFSLCLEAITCIDKSTAPNNVPYRTTCCV